MIHESISTRRTASRRRTAIVATRLGAIGSAVMLMLSIAAAIDITRPSVNAQTNAGNAVVVSAQLPTTGSAISGGGSATVFSLQLPVGAACTGDSVSSDYRVQSYMVPVAVDPASLTYASLGPIPLGVGASYRQPLFTTTTQRYVNVTTGPEEAPGKGGQVPTIPGFDFTAAPFAGGPSFLPAGAYNVGIACTRAAGAVLDKYWNVVMTFANDSSDEPSGLTWSVDSASESTTTTTTDDSTTTSSTVAGATTTSTTTTTVSGTTTTTTVGGGSATTTAPGTTATVTPASPTPGGRYEVSFPNCEAGETITFSQPESTPATVTDTCTAASALASGDGPMGFRRSQQLATGTASASFAAAPTAPGSYTVTMTGTVSAQRTTTFVIAAVTAPAGNTPAVGGSPSGSSSATTGALPSTGSSTTAMIVWGILLLVFGRMAILLGRTPKVITSAG